MLLTFNNTHLTTNQPTIIYSPQLNSNFKLELSQHLLQGFGSLPNTRFIRIAKNNREITDIAFKLQVITTVDQIENIYWDLVYAYENLKVQRDALAFAQKTLSDTEKQVKAGVMAPLQLASAQSTVSADQEVLIVAQTNLELAGQDDHELPPRGGVPVLKVSRRALPERNLRGGQTLGPVGALGEGNRLDVGLAVGAGVEAEQGHDDPPRVGVKNERDSSTRPAPGAPP